MSWITSKLAGPIASGLSLILAITLTVVTLSKNGAIGELRGQLSTVTTERDNAKADLNQCRSNRITLEEATRRQNGAVDAAKAEGDARLAALAKVADRAKTDAAAADIRAKAILNRKGATCEDADALILETVR